MKCSFKSEEEKINKIADFIRKHGDDLPEEAVLLAVSEKILPNWVLECDENNDIISGATYKHNDWFLCTISNLATDPEYRGKGLGTKIVGDIMEKAADNPMCLVMAADITYDNEPSKKIFEKYGFEDKTRFCFGKGEKPADIMHLVKFPPKSDKETCNI